jgi:DNA polymerase-3 subunit gamma/tau
MSTFVVSARKYRPSRFDDVVGQQHVTNTLKNALRNDHLAHAFLFCGPRGVGKTTCARILAKVLNCRNVTEDFEPCNTCDSCTSFNENASFNITELDAASNNSVEHIRALIEQVRFQPQQGKYKVFIIDEVHMLSQQAFNAFLKTLEEPPPYAIFILATTEKHKIIPTILSRCQIFDFKRIQVPSMVGHLEEICTAEGIKAEPEALHVIAQKADGALRDALSIFDRMVSFNGEQIRYEDVITNLNVLDYDYFFRTVDAMIAEDQSQVLLLLNDVINKGFDPDLFINGLASHLRDLLVCQDESTLSLLEVSESLRDRYRRQAAQATPSFLLTALNLANDCDLQYKTALNKRLHVEMALLKMTYAQHAVDLARNGVTSASATEKKTPDLSKEPPKTETNGSSKPETTSKPAEVKVAEPTPQKEGPENTATAKDTNTTSQEDVPEHTSTPEAPEKVPTPPSPEVKPEPPKGTTATPKLGGVNAMMKAFKEKQASEEKERVTEELTLDNVKAHYLKYLEGLEQETARYLLKSVILSLEDKELTATVSSKLVEGALRQEQDLIQSIRDNFGVEDLILKVVIDKSKQRKAPKPKKPLTNKEKLAKMYEQNPNIKELADRFGLRFDD